MNDWVKLTQDKITQTETYLRSLYRVLAIAKNDTVQRTAVDPNWFMNNHSTWDNLVMLATPNAGLITISDAVSVFVAAHLFPDRTAARNAIYSTLYFHKKLGHVKRFAMAYIKLFKKDLITC